MDLSNVAILSSEITAQAIHNAIPLFLYTLAYGIIAASPIVLISLVVKLIFKKSSR